jgi:nucleoid-associated protein YgaU
MMKRWLIVLLLMMIFAFAAFSQSLENNEYYQKSLEYEKLSQEAIDNGEYVQAQEYAILAQQNAALSRQYIAEMLMIYRARSALTVARARMTLADQVNLQSSDSELYEEASTYFSSAENKFDNEDYENSYNDARKVIELLVGIDPRFVPRTNDEEGALAAIYLVKRFPGNEDCLWKIAGYSYIYGDASKWRYIYDANKDTFPEPENPDLIYPGMLLKIPAIRGEERSGTR